MGIDAMDWGWDLQDNRYIPVMSMMNAAPDILIATALILGRHCAALVEMDYHSLPPVDSAKLANVTILGLGNISIWVISIKIKVLTTWYMNHGKLHQMQANLN